LEIQRRQACLPADLRADLAYAIDFDRWLTWCRFKKYQRRKAWFLGDRDYPIGPPSSPAPKLLIVHFSNLRRCIR
jgi:hypothetical protein